MTELRQQFLTINFTISDWEKKYHQNQIEYLRVRLRCVKLFASGLEPKAISDSLSIDKNRVIRIIQCYIDSSYEGLLKRITRKQPTLLSTDQEQAFKTTILTTHPSDHGLNANIWTGQVMIAYIKQIYQVCYKSGIYELLERLNLSHQRAHSDYINADKEEQISFMKGLEQTLYKEPSTTAIVFADEFSVCEKPTAYYGWAEKNTRPKVPTNEKKVKG